MTSNASLRRKFMTTGAVATGAATLGFPAIVKAQTTSLRFQSTWPAKDILKIIHYAIMLLYVHDTYDHLNTPEE